MALELSGKLPGGGTCDIYGHMQMTTADMQALMTRMDELASEADGIARWLDQVQDVQKWVHRDLRSVRACADRIAAHMRQELAGMEQAQADSSGKPAWA